MTNVIIFCDENTEEKYKYKLPTFAEGFVRRLDWKNKPAPISKNLASHKQV